MEAVASAKPKITPPIGGSPWKTETVERPAWGALVPMTVACSLPGAEKEPEGEATAALLPVVMDVALPDMPDEGKPTPSPSTSPVN